MSGEVHVTKTFGLNFTCSRRTKKPSACMKMKKAMKMRKNTKTILKKPAAMKISKKPAGTAAERMRRCRKAKLEAKNQKAEENARGRARNAVRRNKSYSPANARLQKIAASARAACVTAMAAHEVAEGAQQEAAAARSEAAEAKSEAADAREVFDAAHSLAVDAAQRVLNIQEQLSEGKEALRKTQALARHNEQRLNTDDRKRGYCTPAHVSDCKRRR